MFENYVEPILRLILACAVGGLVGIQRESTNRPAGFRTHILVCLGATLAMVTSEYIFAKYGGLTDPARLGAQVISGIGFLGAGTILKEGATVKGLTTAASLWAVACIGLAVGSGFYLGGIVAAVLVYFVLMMFKRIEALVDRNIMLELIIDNVPGKLGEIGQIIANLNAKIKNMNIEALDDEDKVASSIIIKLPQEVTEMEIIAELLKVEGVELQEK